MKDEVYCVAARYGVAVTLVANSRLHVPARLRVEMVVVDGAPDAADDWIAEHVRPGDVVITADIPLAARCLAAGARVLGTNGRVFTEDSIGGALAIRGLEAELRDAGIASRGPAPITREGPLALPLEARRADLQRGLPAQRLRVATSSRPAQRPAGRRGSRRSSRAGTPRGPSSFLRSAHVAICARSPSKRSSGTP